MRRIRCLASQTSADAVGSGMSKIQRYRVAADIGGTFTDVAAFDQLHGRLLLGKTLTTPGHLVDGILEGLRKTGLSLEQAHLFLHGSTVAINTMLERSGARTALVTTRGWDWLNYGSLVPVALTAVALLWLVWIRKNRSLA